MFTEIDPLHISCTQVAVTPRFGGALRVTVYAPIWVVNKTGLPLVFRQEGSQAEAAGQESEHEVWIKIWIKLQEYHVLIPIHRWRGWRRR